MVDKSNTVARPALISATLTLAIGVTMFGVSGCAAGEEDAEAPLPDARIGEPAGGEWLEDAFVPRLVEDAQVQDMGGARFDAAPPDGRLADTRVNDPIVDAHAGGPVVDAQVADMESFVPDGGLEACNCEAPDYCHADICAPGPTLTLDTGNQRGCADLGRNSSPDDPLVRRVITGRPGAVAVQFGERMGCGGPVRESPPFELDDRGVFSDMLVGDADNACQNLDFIGLWRSHVTVDGQASEHVEVIYYNSSCPQYDSCESARWACPTGDM